MPRIYLPPAASAPVNDRDHAIVVGINHYAHGIIELDGAINDCELFCEWLVDPAMGGVDPAKIKFFVSNDPSDDQPMRDQVVNFLLEFFDLANLGQLNGRRLYLFFAGHGLVSPPPDKRGCALVMANARLNALRGLLGVTAADSMRLTGLFQEVMLVMDCCAEVSGPAEDFDCKLPSFGDPNLPARPFLHIVAAQFGKATAERQLVDPLDPARGPRWQGVLTNALLQGLTTAVDVNGQVTARSLKAFLEAGTFGRPQVDTGADDLLAASMTFGKSRGVETRVETKSTAAWFQVRDGSEFKVVLGPFPLPRTIYLAPGQYLFDGLTATGVLASSSPQSIREGGTHVLV